MTQLLCLYVVLSWVTASPQITSQCIPEDGPFSVCCQVLLIRIIVLGILIVFVLNEECTNNQGHF